MEFERDVLVSPTTEVPVIEGEVVTAIRTLAGRGVGKKAIAREVGVARQYGPPVSACSRSRRDSRSDRPRGG